MGKKSEKKNSEELARRRLIKAQLKLEVAQGKQSQARERGQQEIDRARHKAAEWLAKATDRVQRRAREVAAAEAALLARSAPEVPDRRGNGEVVLEAPTPEAAAVVIQQREAEVAQTHPAGPILRPEDTGTPFPPETGGDFHG